MYNSVMLYRKELTFMKKFLYTAALSAALIVTPITAFVGGNDAVVEAAYVNPFTDVKDSNSHAHSIVSLYNEGIVTGVTSTSYQPGKEATRGDAALYLANALGINIATVKDPGFKDIPKTSKYYQAVAALKQANIVGGYDNEFRPNATLTRAQLAKMLTVGFELEQATSTTTKFTDVNKLTDAATKRYIQTLVNYEITKGTTATTFSPNQKLTRGQLATFLYNAMQATDDELTVTSVE